MTAEDVMRKCLQVYQREAPKPAHQRGPLEVELSDEEKALLKAHKDEDGEHCSHITIGQDGKSRVFGVLVK